MRFINFGAVLGRGGDASNFSSNGWKDMAMLGSAKPAGDAMVNTSATKVRIVNFGVIAGGGGAGSDSLHQESGASVRAGGGAPYGLGGITYDPMGVEWPDGYSLRNGANASFTEGGKGGSYNAVHSGNGGKWGFWGTAASDNKELNQPGYAFRGDFAITNLGDGRSIGR